MSALNLFKFSEVEAGGAPTPEFEVTTRWIREFLAVPHPLLGRSGPVCPFVPLAIRFDTILFASIQKNSVAADEVGLIEEAVFQGKAAFDSMEPTVGPHAVFRSVLLLFPWVAMAADSTYIDRVQQRIKPHFVRSGLMLGEFHSWSAAPGLHSDNIRPLQSPVPLLAIRTMVEQDLIFLCRESDPPETRRELLLGYLGVFGDGLSPERLEKAHFELERARSQVSVESFTSCFA